MHCEFVGNLRVRFVKKIQYWIRKSEGIRKRIFCFSLPDRSIQDLSDHGASKKPKNPLLTGVDSSVPLTHHDPKDLELICLIKKPQNPFRI